MSAVYLGDFSVTGPHDVNYKYTPNQGWTTTFTYTGQQARIDTIADQYAISNTGASLEISQDSSPLRKLVVTFDYKYDGSPTTSEVPINNWELLGSDLNKDVYEGERMIALGASVITAIRLAVQNVNAADVTTAATAYSDATGAITAAALAAGVSQSDALDFFDVLVKGTTSFPHSEFVLKRTQSVSNTYATKFALNDINKLYTTEQILAEAEIPSTIIFDISLIEVPPPQLGYTWAWLKRSPQVATSAGARIQVTQEYWLEQWADILYRFKT